MSDSNSTSSNSVNQARLSEDYSLYVDECVLAHEKEYIDPFLTKVLILSWNINTRDPIASLKRFADSKLNDNPDIICLGFQEVDMSLRSIVLNDTSNREEMDKQIQLVFNKKYEMVFSRHLGGISLYILSSPKFRSHIKYVKCECVTFGFLNMANKGAIVASMTTFLNSTLCFICAHFPAHLKNVAQRNEAFSQIASRVVFEIDDNLVQIERHDFVFWFGDLNYRTDCDITGTKLDEEMVNNRIEALIKLDQLAKQMSEQKAFVNYNEAPICFKPTYKLESGRDKYSWIKDRFPSWTDRILWKFEHPQMAQILVYDSLKGMGISDHQPVYAVFTVMLFAVNPQKRERVCENVKVEIDNYLNSTRPKVALSCNDFDFLEMEFGTPMSLDLQVKNVGDVDCFISLFRTFVTSSSIDSWLSVNTNAFCLKRETTSTFTFTALVNEFTLRRLGGSVNGTGGVWVLKVMNGPEYFLTFSMTYQRGCLGYPLDELVKINHPLKEPSLVFYQDVPCLSYSIPVQLLSMTQHITQETFPTNLLFQSSAIDKQVLRVIDMLDHNPNCSILRGISSEVVSRALVLFFKCLPIKLISASTMKCKTICLDTLLDDLLPPYNCIFRHMLIFFHELTAKVDKYGLDNSKIALLFGRILVSSELFKNQQFDLESRVTDSVSLLLYFLKS